MKTRVLRSAFGIILTTLGIAVHHVSAGTLDVWSLRNPHLSLGQHWNVDYLNGQFVAFGGPSAGLATSVDGTNWSVIPQFPVPPFSVGDLVIEQIVYGNGQYVAVGRALSGGYSGGSLLGSFVANSPDLKNWSISVEGSESNLTAIAFGGGVFAVVGNAVITSTNGIDWTHPNLATNGMVDITYGNGRFVGASGGPSPQVVVSTDGVLWTPVTITNASPAQFFTSISFAEGRFYAGGYYDVIGNDFPVLEISTDGFSWTPGTFSEGGGIGNIRAISGNGILLGVCPFLSPLNVSTNGTNFVAISPNNFSSYPAVAFGNGLFVDGGLQTSLDGTNWSASAVPPTNNSVDSVADIFTGTNGYTAFTTPVTDALLLSPNGLQFSFVTNVAPYTRVKIANGLYHAVGPNGNLGRSTNGLDWAGRNSATTSALHDIEFGNSTWVAVGDSGTITTSPTGNAWTLRTSGTSLALNGIVYGASQFVVVGAQGTVLTSPDGITWTAQFSGTLENLEGITFENSQFVAVGANGTVGTSPDGVNWTSQVSGVGAELTAIAFGEGTFCAVGGAGGTNVVLTSTDAVSWIQRNSGALQLLTGGTADVRFLNGTFFVCSDTNIVQSGPVTPVQLQISMSSNTPQIGVQASSNLLLKLQSAGALLGPWQNLGIFTNPPGGSFVYPDGSADGLPQRFYRAAAP